MTTLTNVSEAPRCALAVYAHPDDSDVAAGGTLSRWASEGCEVHVIICAIGDKGSMNADEDVECLVARRTDELLRAQTILGVAGVHRLNYRDGEVENAIDLRRKVVGIMRSVRPDALICPDPTAVIFGEHYFNHHDHRAVGYAALDSAMPAASSPLYFPDQGPATSIGVAYLSGSLQPNVYVEITDFIERKAEAILCHRSQLGDTSEWFRSVVHDRAREAGRTVGVDFAEAFRRVGLSH